MQVLESHSNTNKVPGDISDEEHYLAFAQQTRGLMKFAKVAYPDLVGGFSPPDLEEPLLEKNKQACRFVCLFVLKMKIHIYCKMAREK